MKIYDPGCFKRIAEVEFSPFRFQYCTPPFGPITFEVHCKAEDAMYDWMLDELRSKHENSFNNVLTRWNNYIAGVKAGFLSETTSAIGVIYGDGGWNRYMVAPDGTVHFSGHHATPKTHIPYAVAAGFPLW